jgi:hypothetical protein
VVIFRMECEIDIFIDMLLYKSEIMTFLTFQCTEMRIRLASCDGFVDFGAIMMEFKL